MALTTGNIDDRKPVRELLKGQFGQFFGDKGYISAALAEDLRNSGIILVTKFKKRMKNKLMTMLDKQLLLHEVRNMKSEVFSKSEVRNMKSEVVLPVSLSVEPISSDEA